MDITIIAVGKLKEKYWEAAVAEYSRRIGAYARLNMLEALEEKPRGHAEGPAAEAIIMQREGERILSRIDSEDFVVALDRAGHRLSSEELADFLRQNMTRGVSGFTFLIGGSLGLSPETLRRANFHLSFSSFTFPHQLMRVILLEQLYRVFKIMRGEPYHK